MHAVLFLVSVGVALVTGYPEGPPVGNEGLCETMDPTGHGAQAQTDSAPYEYVMSSTCYKEGMEVQVAIKSTHTDSAKRYFEGFFVQVQESGKTNVNYGTFSTDDTEYSKPYTCFEVADSTIGHQKYAHFATRVFTWTAPTSAISMDLHFRGTVVKSKEVYWTEIMSPALTYDDACTAGSFNETSSMQEEETSTATSPLPGLLVAMATILSALILP